MQSELKKIEGEDKGISQDISKQARLPEREPGSVLVQDSELEVPARVSLNPRQARVSWAEQFDIMAQEGDNVLLDDLPQATTWDEEEWTW